MYECDNCVGNHMKHSGKKYYCNMEEAARISRLQLVIGFTMHVGLMRMHSAR